MLNQHRLMELAKTQAEANHNYIIGLLILPLMVHLISPSTIWR
jgi:hypothetical protein